ncbi:MAG: PepSY domain-containing protein [Gammaproteobacteria bacterium]|jgi:uncharacterized membrane protein YkoI
MNAACKIIALFTLAVVLLVANPVLADSDYDRAQQLRQVGEILPLETILQKLHTSHPGKVLEVELENEHGQVIYEIEILDNKGKVRKVKVNAKTGELLQQKKDD